MNILGEACYGRSLPLSLDKVTIQLYTEVTLIKHHHNSETTKSLKVRKRCIFFPVVWMILALTLTAATPTKQHTPQSTLLQVLMLKCLTLL